MTKVKLILLLSSIFWGFPNSLIAQTDYQLNFYKCGESKLKRIDHKLHSPEIIISDYVTNEKIECKQASSGTYYFSTNKEILRVNIRNIYNQKFDTILELQENKTEYDLCGDQFKNYDLKTSVEKALEDRKKWTLQYSAKATGSKNQIRFQDESITITFSKNKIHATYRVNRIKVEKTKITNEQKEALILFEKKLKLLNRTNTSCHLTTAYYISSFAENFKVENNTCLWDGFNELKTAFGF